MSKTSEQFDTRVARQALLDGLDKIKASVEHASLERKIEVGSLLWDLGDRVKEVLDFLKEEVRKEALERLEHQPGSVTLFGEDLGSVTVTLPNTALRVPRGTDVESIKTALGNKFSLFFEETVTYKPQKEFETRVFQLEDTFEQKVLMDAVERKELTPRVSFKRDRIKD